MIHWEWAERGPLSGGLGRGFGEESEKE